MLRFQVQCQGPIGGHLAMIINVPNRQKKRIEKESQSPVKSSQLVIALFCTQQVFS